MRISSSCWILLVASVAVVHIGFLAIPAVATTSNVPGDFDGRCIIDITHPLRDDIPSFGSPTGAGKILNETIGTSTVTGTFRIGTHLGTHVDAPSHIFMDQFERGVTVDSLNLTTLIGPVLVVQTPDDTNINAQVVDSLEIPRGVKRVIFKTSNTKRKLMDQQAFAENYIGFTTDGAQRLVDQTDVIFVGIDYMSVAIISQVVDVHTVFLGAERGIIPVENLKLDEVKPGTYTVYCLPIRLLAEASPARCILVA